MGLDLATPWESGGTLGVASLPPPLATNPYQRLLYEHLAKHGTALAPPARLRARWLWQRRSAVQVLHFHWPQPYYVFARGPRAVRGSLTALRIVAFGARLVVARALGYRIVWTIHQVDPHERRGAVLDRTAAVLLARAAHVLVAHDESTACDARRMLRLRRQRIEVVPHGSYIGVYPLARSGSATREALGIADTAFVFLCLGLLRPYKGIELLLEAWRRVESDDAVLVIAGRPLDDALARNVEQAAAADRRIVPLLRYVPDDEVAELFAAADAAVVARSDGGTSGALILALSLGVPVVACDAPAYVELLGGGTAGWLFTGGDSASLHAALAAAAGDRSDAEDRGGAALRRATELDWDGVAEQVYALMTGRRAV